MLNKEQIKLVQTAVRAAGLRGKGAEGRYRFLLSRYTQPDGTPVTSCKQLNNGQLDDLLAICEAQGFQRPDAPADFYRSKIFNQTGFASDAQHAAIRHLAGDLGWTDEQLGGMLSRMTKKRCNNLALLWPEEAYKIIEALKAMFNRAVGTKHSTLKNIKEEQEARDGANQA